MYGLLTNYATSTLSALATTTWKHVCPACSVEKYHAGRFQCSSWTGVWFSDHTGEIVVEPRAFLFDPNASTLQTTTKSPTAKLLQQPSISITPLPRQTNTSSSSSPVVNQSAAKPGQQGGKNSFVICEICDGYIKVGFRIRGFAHELNLAYFQDLEQLRNHMQWIHKVKIHPKMIYNRPPLNCQKCQFRFFTDQGLERHLLGSHGLVTSSMQEASNKGKDGGRCPVCGRVSPL